MRVLDKHGYEIGQGARGWRVCGHCGVAMSAGYSTDCGDIYACSDICLEEQGWKVPTEDDDIDEDGACYWTEWDEYVEEDNWPAEEFEAGTGPVTLTEDGMPRLDYQLEAWHMLGLHDGRSDTECNYCLQLFDSTHDEAVAEAESIGLDIL